MPKMLDNSILAAVPDPKAYSVTINWANGGATVSIFGHLVGRGVFAAFLNPAVFARVRVGDRGRSVEWPGEIDFCADALWLVAHPADESPQHPRSAAGQEARHSAV
ncbi:MAG: hypothetical protein QOJ54_1204 [Aliidongia sp.]|jgi:hypothetical protein|nr:hypothetical protein [Aliidongia sp.]